MQTSLHEKHVNPLHVFFVRKKASIFASFNSEAFS